MQTKIEILLESFRILLQCALKQSSESHNNHIKQVGREGLQQNQQHATETEVTEYLQRENLAQSSHSQNMRIALFCIAKECQKVRLTALTITQTSRKVLVQWSLQPNFMRENWHGSRHGGT